MHWSRALSMMSSKDHMTTHTINQVDVEKICSEMINIMNEMISLLNHTQILKNCFTTCQVAIKVKEFILLVLHLTLMPDCTANYSANLARILMTLNSSLILTKCYYNC